MGGHAFHYLSTPRISRELYLLVQSQTTKALQTLFRHVCVPTEIPGKRDFGDVDFLVAGPLTQSPSSITSSVFDHEPGDIEFDYDHHVSKIKEAFGTRHGRRGVLTPNVMYFAIPCPGREDEFHIQIDVKVCSEPDMFEWEKFCLGYATVSQILGSMGKPVGLTVDPLGLWIRVEGLEVENWEGSLVYLGRGPGEVLRVFGVDGRLMEGNGEGLDRVFREKDSLFEYLAGSWLFNPAHFAERMKDENYIKHLYERQPSYVSFVKSYIPDTYPGYKFKDPETADLDRWYKTAREAVRDKVFSLYPSAAKEYYEKRDAYLKDVEERRLRELVMAAIPVGIDGWEEDLPQPPVIIKPSSDLARPRTPEPQAKPTTKDLFPLIIDPQRKGSTSSSTSSEPSSTSPSSPATSLSSSIELDPPQFPHPRSRTGQNDSTSTPLLLDPLPRTPPIPFTPHPCPEHMSLQSKLECVYRWTLFTPSGTPYIASEPRPKKNFTMDWASAVTAGASDAILVEWTQSMWWAIWARQFRVNYQGMWKKRMEKEDAKAARAAEAIIENEKLEEEMRVGREAAKARRASKEKLEKDVGQKKEEEEMKGEEEEKKKMKWGNMMARLSAVNTVLGLGGAEAEVGTVKG